MTEEEIGPKVLIVDDMATTRAVIRDMLTEMGIEHIRECKDVPSALSSLRQQPVHLVISDYKMGELSGMDLLALVRREHALKKIPFIMISAHPDVDSCEGSQILQASAFIFKPLEFNVLKNAVISALKTQGKENVAKI